MILAIDFDGVIHDHKRPLKGRRMGEPIEGAKEVMTRLRDGGDTLIVHSVWASGAGKDAIADWMQFYEIPFDDITNVKPKADVYLDDKAVKFVTWDEFVRERGLEPPSAF